jgi:hypothetical protein
MGALLALEVGDGYATLEGYVEQRSAADPAGDVTAGGPVRAQLSDRPREGNVGRRPAGASDNR